MSRNDEFDQTLRSWLQRQAPPEAPDRVLDAALERVAGESQQRRLFHRFFGGTTMTIMIRTAAVAAVVAIAALVGYQVSNLNTTNVGTSPSPNASSPVEPSNSASISASPSLQPSEEPSAAALVFRLLGGGEAGRVHLVTLLDDGRLVTSDLTGATPPEERRLTEAGVQLVRDEMDATGLTDTSADYNPEPNPGVEDLGFGGAGPSLEVGQPSGETVVITWYLFADTEADRAAPQPEAEALDALAARLSTLAEWLPDSAWSEANASPYEAQTYRIFFYSQPWGDSLDELPVETATVAWPQVAGGDVVGDAAESVAAFIGDGDSPPECLTVTADEAMSVMASLDVAGATPDVYSTFPGTAFALGHRATSRSVTITLEPILPLADSACLA